MKRRNWTKRFLILALTWNLVSVSVAFAQDSKPKTSTQKTSNATVNDELLKSLEIALARLESAERVKGLQADELDALRAKITTLEALVAIERQRAEAWRTAAQERATANTLDEKRVALFQESIDLFKTEVIKLRQERDSAKRSRNTWTIIGAAIGIAIGSWLKTSK